MKLALVEWIDAYGCSTEWVELANIKPGPLHCSSVGWIVAETDECLVVCPHVSHQHDEADRQGCGDMTIPQAAVSRVVELTIPGED